MAQRFRAAICIGLLAASGCGGGGSGSRPSSPPAITHLTYSPTNAAQSSSPASVTGSLDFTDAGGDVTKLNLTVLDAAGTQVSSASAPIQGVSGQTSGTITGQLSIPAANPGLYTVRVTISDQGGAVSNALTGTFRIAAAANQAKVVAPTAVAARLLQADGGFLYWSEIGTNVIKRVPVGGGTVEGLAPKIVSPSAAVMVGSDVVWLDARQENGVACGVVHVVSRSSPAGSTAILGEAGNCASYTATDLVVDGGTVFWVSSTQSPDIYSINATPVAGGPTTTIATSITPIVALAGQGGVLYWMENRFAAGTAAIRSVPMTGGAVTTIASSFGSSANTFAVDAGAVYYTTPTGTTFSETLLAQPLAGGAAVTLASAIPTPVKLASDGTTLVWVDTTPAGVMNSSHVSAIPVAGGAPVVLASSTLQPVDLIISGGNAVWSEDRVFGNGTPGIRSVPLAGGAATTLYQASDAPQKLALDAAGQIVWTEIGPYYPNSYGGGRVARLLTPTTGQTLVAGISVDAPTFIVAGSDLVVIDSGRLKRVPIAGGIVETIAVESGPITDLTSDGTNVYWDVGAAVHAVPLTGGPTTALATGAGYTRGGPIRVSSDGVLYWVADDTNLLSVPAAGGGTTLAAQGLSRVSGLAIDTAAVYAASADAGAIVRVPRAGGAWSELTFTGFFPNDGLAGLTSDGTSVYWIDRTRIAKVPVTGGDPDPVVDFTVQVAFGGDYSSLAVDGTQVYWTEPNPQDIRASAK